MTRVAVLALAVLAAGVSACGTTAAQHEGYSARLDRLEADCREREGILIPTGATTGRPETEYACKITGGASRLTPGG